MGLVLYSSTSTAVLPPLWAWGWACDCCRLAAMISDRVKAMMLETGSRTAVAEQGVSSKRSATCCLLVSEQVGQSQSEERWQTQTLIELQVTVSLGENITSYLLCLMCSVPPLHLTATQQSRIDRSLVKTNPECSERTKNILFTVYLLFKHLYGSLWMWSKCSLKKEHITKIN